MGGPKFCRLFPIAFEFRGRDYKNKIWFAMELFLVFSKEVLGLWFPITLTALWWKVKLEFPLKCGNT